MTEKTSYSKSTAQDALTLIFDHAVEKGVMNRDFADILITENETKNTITDDSDQLTDFGRDLCTLIGAAYVPRFLEIDFENPDNNCYVYIVTFKD